MGSNARRERHQSSLPWDMDLEEVAKQPPHMIVFVPCSVVYRRRRRAKILTPTSPHS